jgi:hypothetical protein
MSDSPSWARKLVDKNARVVQLVVLVVICAAASAIFVLSSSQYGNIGFPLDDAWIHQTYARNLIQFGQWVYFPGQVSAGSTSPLWTIFLSVAYLVSNKIPYAWTLILGFLSLLGLALAGEQIFRNLSANVRSKIPWVGIFLATEWHLVWGSASGMETILFGALILVVFVCLTGPRQSYLLAGILAGITVWVRPDGITLLGPAIFIAALLPQAWKIKIQAAMKVLGGFAVPFIGYLIFNLIIAGNLWPNTFYAKQAEYAVMIDQPFLQRFGNLIALPLIGAGCILIPGFIFASWKSIRDRDWNAIALLLWWLGYTLIYAIRLPVTYQHGRYLIPAMPIYFIVGLIGTAQFLKAKYTINRLKWYGSKLILASLVGVQIVFGFQGALAYRQDVGIINSEMVATAEWLNDNISPNAVIAAHDIGAIGYFSQLQILDLAGLVSPEVIPFIRDEIRLAAYLDENHAEYLVTFPGWYPYLISLASPIHQTDGKFSILAGGENMTVYQWRK